jgi:hypothetical protein
MFDGPPWMPRSVAARPNARRTSLKKAGEATAIKGNRKSLENAR